MKKNQDGVAIVGIGCRLPGRANSPESLWSMLMERTDAITEIPKDRWNIEKYYHPDIRAEGRSYSKWGGFVEEIDRFDPEAFAISPREAEFMDPQQRLLLEVAWEAMEDGGYQVEGLSGTQTGVFLGLCTNEYSQIQSDQNEIASLDPHSSTGSAISIAANRLSYCFNFHGPSLVVDTACSSSLVATHLGCASLLDGECDLALVGGANLILLPEPFISFCAATMLSADGRCKAFDARADGFVRGEGAAIVVLKRLSDTLADGNSIYGLIKASGVNSDGRTNGISLPSKQAQAELIDQIYRQAGIATNDVFYVEAHGTGTAVGDPIEAAVLGEKFGVARANGDCIIGSVKSNIGHLEGGAGIAGLIKAALCLKHRMIPPSLHFETPNPNIPFDELHLRVPVEPVVYPDDADKAMTIGVNSFGFGGTNAHAVLSEFRPVLPESFRPVLPESAPAPRSEFGGLYLLPLSARSIEGLKILAQSYIEYLAVHSDLQIADVVYSAALKTHYAVRTTVAAANVSEAVQQLNAFIADESSLAIVNGHINRGAVFKTAFVFSGQGPQWWAMGRQMLQAEPVFKAMVLRCNQLMSQYADWSLYEELTASESESRIAETEISQPLLFALQVALAEVWKARGVTPDAVVGHSVGEVAAAYISGALDLAAAVKVIFYRGLTMSHAGGEGGMLAAALTQQQAEVLIEPFGDSVTLAALNSPSSVTLSGQPEQLKLLAEQLDGQGVFNRMLDVQFAFHSAQMDSVKDELFHALTAIQLAEIKLPIYSTVTGKRVTENCFDADYWWRNIREKVRFSPAISAMSGDGYDIFIEIGPHPVLRASILEAAQGEKPHVLASLRRMQDEPLTFLGSLGSLYCLGYPLTWQKVNQTNGCLVRLPGYPWQKQRYWHESQQWLERRTGDPAHPLLMARDSFANMSWSSTIDPVIYSYLADHKVRDNIVFPAAGYIEMSIAAAHQCFPNDAFVLEDIQIRKALYINSDQYNPRLQFSIDANDHAFTIRSGSPFGDSPWTTHCKGYLRKISKPAKTVDVNAYQQTCKYLLAADDIYRYYNEIGLQFGPSFRGLAGVYAGTERALGDVRLQPENVAQADRYYFHPAQLDACFQSLIGAVGKDLKRTYLPVAINQLRFHAKAEAKMWACVDLIHLNEYSMSGNVRVCSANGDLLLEILGFRGQYVDMASQESRIDDEFYRYQWIPRPLPVVEENSVQQATFFPEFTQLANRMRQEAISVSERFGGIERLLEMAKALDRLGVAYIVQGLAELGCPTQPGDSLTVEALLNEYQVKLHYRLLLRRLFNILATYAYVELQTPEAAIIKQPLSVPGLRSSWADTLAQFPGAYAELSLIRNCGSCLAAVLKGEIDPLHLLFPDGSSTLAEHLYTDSPSNLRYLTMIREAVSIIVEALPLGRRLRILEIGAGTGGLTTHLLSLLPRDKVSYVFSDISAAFFIAAEQRFNDYHFIDYRVLNIEKSPLEQDFSANSFDLILASNVLHATADLKTALRNIHQLLTPQGALVVLEVEARSPWIDTVFGLTDGWWRFKDFDLRPDYPVITHQQWRQVLTDCGFINTVITGDLAEVSADSPQLVFLAQAAKEEIGESDHRLALPTDDNSASVHWLIFADQQGTAAALQDYLAQHRYATTLLLAGEELRPIADRVWSMKPDDKAQLDQACRSILTSKRFNILHLWSLDSEPLASAGYPAMLKANSVTSHTLLYLIQCLDEIGIKDQLERLILVTRGAQALELDSEGVNVVQSPLIGLARVIQVEHPELNCCAVDLDPRAQDLNALFAELFNQDGENEVAYRYRQRFVPRLRKAERPLLWLDNSQSGAAALSFRLQVAQAGAINNLRLQQIKLPRLQPTQVEVEVHAAALNFRDVMKTLGLYPTDDGGDTLLGDECSGVVSTIGSEVSNVNVGDEVMVIGNGNFAARIITESRLLMAKPKHLSHQEATTLPVVFLTAYYALHHLGQIQKGDRILIQAAAGGVGQAAVQIAKHAGAEVFVTGSNQEKRELLKSLGADHIMNSRNLAFADQVKALTNGTGVDIVLNSLAGDAMAKGIDCLAPYGRFLELGKMDIYQNNKIGLWAFRKNLAFYAIDLGSLMRDKPELLRSILQAVHDLVEQRVLKPLPHRTFPVSRVKDAFRFMAQGKHIGKVVISMRERHIPVYPLPSRRTPFDRQGSYLITGGYGGFGLILARWIGKTGGGTVILVSRSGGDEKAKQTVAELRAAGMVVVTEQADVAEAGQVAELAQRCREKYPPLKGIFHAAMVMDDGIILQLNADRFEKVMAPKVQGVWNLHQAFSDLSLDYFILFSSFSSIMGNAGQASYVAANFFLDMFAHYRRSLGLPAIAINWGALSEVGFMVNQGLVKLWETRGVKGIKPKQAILMLERILSEQPVQTIPILVDWPALAKKYRHRKLPLRFSEIIDENDLRIDEEQGGNIREQIDQSEPVQCEEIITRYLRNQISAVLRVSADRLELDQPLNELGLDSLMMVELGIRIENDLSISLPTGQLMQTPSLQGLTQVILKVLGKDGGKIVAVRDTKTAAPKFPGCLLPLNTTGLEYNLFCFHPAGGLVNDFNLLAEYLEGRLSVFGLQSCLLAGADQEFGSIEEMAGEYVKSILQQQPTGSYYFLGFSFGGLIALEAARLLTAQGRPVAFLGMLDTIVDFDDRIAKIKTQLIQELSQLFLSEFHLFGPQDEQEKQQCIDEIQSILQIESEQSYGQAVVDWIKRKDFPIEANQIQIISNYLALFSRHGKLLENYRVEPINDVAIDYWHASEGIYEDQPNNPVLLELSGIHVRQHQLIGRHYQVLQQPSVSVLSEEIIGRLMPTKTEITSNQ